MIATRAPVGQCRDALSRARELKTKKLHRRPVVGVESLGAESLIVLDLRAWNVYTDIVEEVIPLVT